MSSELGCFEKPLFRSNAVFHLRNSADIFHPSCCPE